MPPLDQQDTAADEPLRRKQLRIRQDLIDKAQAILGTRTASETIRRALQEVIASQREMLDAVDGMYGAGVANVFDEEQLKVI